MAALRVGIGKRAPVVEAVETPPVVDVEVIVLPTAAGTARYRDVRAAPVVGPAPHANGKFELGHTDCPASFGRIGSIFYRDVQCGHTDFPAAV